MFEQNWTLALVALAGLLGSLSVANAEERNAAGGGKQITNSIGMKLVLMPAGEFMMGGGEPAEATVAFFEKTYADVFFPREHPLRDEHPQHRVRITRPFYLGTCDVTRGQFREFVKDTRYKTDAEKGENPGALGWIPGPHTGRCAISSVGTYSWRKTGFEQTDQHPVVNVSWNDAVAFCRWLSRREGKVYRLPTEAEWEYACRAGTKTRYYSGDDPEALARVGNVADATFKARFPTWRSSIRASDGFVFTAPVGSFIPNAFGLYDMHGNCENWCSDWYAADYYAKSPADAPTGPGAGENRVVRGSCWHDPPALACSAARSWAPPDSRMDWVGFRVARTP